MAVELATVCGSDLHTSPGDRPGPAPSVLGHETVGASSRSGPGRPRRDVRGRRLAVGDRVVVGIYAACGACRPVPDRPGTEVRDLFKYGHVPSEGWTTCSPAASPATCTCGAGTPLVRVDDVAGGGRGTPGVRDGDGGRRVVAAVADSRSPVDLAAPSIALAGRPRHRDGRGSGRLDRSGSAGRPRRRVTVVDPHADRRDRARYGSAPRAPSPPARRPSRPTCSRALGSPARGPVGSDRVRGRRHGGARRDRLARGEPRLGGRRPGAQAASPSAACTTTAAQTWPPRPAGRPEPSDGFPTRPTFVGRAYLRHRAPSRRRGGPSTATGRLPARRRQLPTRVSDQENSPSCVATSVPCWGSAARRRTVGSLAGHSGTQRRPGPRPPSAAAATSAAVLSEDFDSRAPPC